MQSMFSRNTALQLIRDGVGEEEGVGGGQHYDGLGVQPLGGQDPPGRADHLPGRPRPLLQAHPRRALPAPP